MLGLLAGVVCRPVKPGIAPASPTDADLAREIMAAPAGEARLAEAELCRRFARRVRLYGARHLPDAADDLTQRTLEVTLHKLRAGEVREPERIASFVLGVARMQAQAMRRRARREEPAARDVAPEVVAEATPERRPLAVDRLARCLEELGGRERSVLLLTYFDDRSAAEIAAKIGVSPGNVRVIRHRAIERLRRCMGRSEGAS